MADAASVPVATASLYVGNLHPNVTESQLYDVFAVTNNLSSVKVCRDSKSGTSLGYGYVNFATTHDAMHAIEILDQTPVNGKPIRTMWSHCIPNASKVGIGGNLFVKNLDYSINNLKLYDMFCKYGNILSSKVAMSQEGKSKGYGFVQFDSEESAKAAIENINGSTVEGKQIYVDKFVKKSDRIATSPAQFTNLYVKNLDMDVTEELLKEKFSEFGKITSLTISKDNDGNSKGFGFVNFESTDNAKRAMEAMNGTQLGSKALYVGRAQKKAEREQILCRQIEEKRKEKIQKYEGSNVYIKNIADDVDDGQLKELFRNFGKIISSKLMRDEKGTSKGFAFMCFSSPEEANKVVSNFNGYMLHGKPLYAAIAQRKEARQAYLQHRRSQKNAGLGGTSAGVVPNGYPPVYCPTAPHTMVPPIPQVPEAMYQPLGMKQVWRTNNGFVAPNTPIFQHVPPPLPAVVNAPPPELFKQKWHHIMCGHKLPQGGAGLVPFPQPAQQRIPSVHSCREPKTKQRAGKNNRSTVPFASHGPKMTNDTRINAASPDQQKQILGDYLYPLVQKLKYDNARKLTGMILELDNSEVIRLLQSPEALMAKVNEADHVLKLSQEAEVVGKTALQPCYIPAEEVAVVN